MCKQLLWAVDGGAYTPAFTAWAEAALGVAPERVDGRIESKRVPRSAAHFLLTRAVCDCEQLIGARDADVPPHETQAEAWLAWIAGMPTHVPQVRRLAVLHALDAFEPTRASGVAAADVDEARLRGLREGALLTIDFAARGPETAERGQDQRTG